VRRGARAYVSCVVRAVLFGQGVECGAVSFRELVTAQGARPVLTQGGARLFVREGLSDHFAEPRTWRGFGWRFLCGFFGGGAGLAGLALRRHRGVLLLLSELDWID